MKSFVFNSLFNLCKTNFLQSVSKVSYLVTHTLQNCCQFHLKHIKVLIVTHQLTLGEFFLIFRKLLIKWHDGLIFKLRTYGTDGDLLKLLINCLEDPKQRVVLNGQTPSWKIFLAGVPQGSVLGSFVF